MLNKIREIPGFEDISSFAHARAYVKSSWDDFTPDKKTSLYSLACRIGESIDDLDRDDFIDEIFSKFEQDSPEYKKEVKDGIKIALSPLSQFSDEQLQQELEKRSQSRKQRPQIPERPEPLEIDAQEEIQNIRLSIEKMIDTAIAKKYWEPDNAQYLYEKILETLYGKEFWDWEGNLPLL